MINLNRKPIEINNFSKFSTILVLRTKKKLSELIIQRKNSIIVVQRWLNKRKRGFEIELTQNPWRGLDYTQSKFTESMPINLNYARHALPPNFANDRSQEEEKGAEGEKREKNGRRERERKKLGSKNTLLFMHLIMRPRYSAE